MNIGLQNELNIIESLNGKKYCELNKNLKNFISFIFEDFDLNSYIYAEKIDNLQKADILIKVNNNEKYISIKTGSENSVHTEKLSNFISFLENKFVNINIINYLRLYHYGDGTINGSGEKRYSADESKIRLINEISRFNNYINHDNLLLDIINRFLFKGVKETNMIVDYIYYGNEYYGIWASREEIINFLLKNKCYYMKTIHFSSLTYQNWCRNINKKATSEKRRNYIQIKWFSIVSDLQKIRNHK